MKSAREEETAGHPSGLGLSWADARLLTEAHLDLLAAQAHGVQVLGSTDGAGVLDAAWRRMEEPIEPIEAVDANIRAQIGTAWCYAVEKTNDAVSELEPRRARPAQWPEGRAA